LRTIPVLILIFLFAGCAATGTQPHTHDQFTQHYEDSLFKVTEKGMFSVELVIKEHELRTGMNMVELIIHDRKDKDVIGAEVTVTPWMPEMGHGVFENPVITERGGGLYSVENIILIMKGHWELRVAVKKEGLEDTVVFDFPDVKVDTGHAHEMTHVPAGADLDLSSSKLTDDKIFSVSYTSDTDPVPINKIHSWTLTVETADGRPVIDAQIALDGDMPEHGHGLPTEPEVTMELPNGVYLIEGMKFSMPGWWTLTFSITTREKEDRVTFNLMLKE
jgi:hypothetical protein